MKKNIISRRDFFKVGSLAMAGSALSYQNTLAINPEQTEEKDQIKIKEYRRLGRTGFKASDISMGCIGITEPNVVRYAYDHGVNYFDTAEGYGKGDSEKKIGEAMQFMDRKKIFITTKLVIRDDDTKETILERFGKCQERLKTDYVDCLYMHSVQKVEWFNNPFFHETVKELKASGRLKHAGISSHGPRSDDLDSMEKVLCAAAEDGRFDLMLLVYSFMNNEPGKKIMEVCKKNNVGTSAMKTAPGVIKAEIFDPENPDQEAEDYISRVAKQGVSREDAIKRIIRWSKRQQESEVKTKPFLEKYGIKTEDQLFTSSIQWVLNNKDMHTTCIAMRDFDLLEKVIPLSGTKLSHSNKEFLKDYGKVFNNRFCRQACNECNSQCPHNLPVSTIMRYVYYYEHQGHQKFAMQRYSKLNGKDANLCENCDANCKDACPHKFDIQASMVRAHSLLTIA
jgi:predicted aldo/keto reductase-like oxidoreductase